MSIEIQPANPEGILPSLRDDTLSELLGIPVEGMLVGPDGVGGLLIDHLLGDSSEAVGRPKYDGRTIDQLYQAAVHGNLAVLKSPNASLDDPVLAIMWYKTTQAQDQVHLEYLHPSLEDKFDILNRYFTFFDLLDVDNPKFDIKES